MTGISTQVTGNSLKVADVSFLGTATIYVTVTDGVLSTTQSFQVTFSDSTPVITQPGSQTVTHAQTS